MEKVSADDKSIAFRMLPSIDELLGTKTAQAMIAELGRKRVLSLARKAAESVRGDIQKGFTAEDGENQTSTRELLLERTVTRLDGAWQAERNLGIQRVINATGVVIHTNLGRAPLSENARRAMFDASGYCTLEYDVKTGKRGGRFSNAEKLLASISGAEDALIVNNCAAAALLVLSVFAKGGEVLVSRGELVEIGGDFRIPDVLVQSGAVLREVGTTNRTKLSDYKDALGEQSKLLLRVHPSNYRVIGFTDKPSIADLADLAHANGLVLYEDAGSGAVLDLKAFGINEEPVISESINSGADIVSFSGDKLLGGPQSGLIVGRYELIEQLRKHPLYRALRIDKIIGAALEATLEAYVRETANEEIPVLRMLAMSAETIEERARSFKVRLEAAFDLNDSMKVEIVRGTSAVGGGAGPDLSLYTALIALMHKTHSDAELERLLRLAKPPVIARIVAGNVMIDLRTVSESDENELIDIIKSIN